MTAQLRVESKQRRTYDNMLSRRSDSLWLDAFRRLLKNRAAVLGGIILIILVLSAIFADYIAVKPYYLQVLEDQNKGPAWLTTVFPTMKPYLQISSKYPLGADSLGRDVFSRIIYGSRISLSVAFIGPILSLIIGVTYGCISGFLGGKVDNLMMRIVDILYAFPTILFIILLMAFFRGTLARPDPGTAAFMNQQA